MKTCKKGLHQYDKKTRTCPECKKEFNKQWRIKNNDKIKQYYVQNKEEILKRQKQRRDKNKKKILKQAQHYYESNRREVLKNKKQFYLDFPDKRKNRDLLHYYNIDLNTYNSMLKKQNFSCAICEKKAKLHKSGKYHILNIDHDHNHCFGRKSCGKCIRGLLCINCNTFLGKFENKKIFLNALEYLKTYEKLQQES